MFSHADESHFIWYFSQSLSEASLQQNLNSFIKKNTTLHRPFVSRSDQREPIQSTRQSARVLCGYPITSSLRLELAVLVSEEFLVFPVSSSSVFISTHTNIWYLVMWPGTSIMILTFLRLCFLSSVLFRWKLRILRRSEQQSAIKNQKPVPRSAVESRLFVLVSRRTESFSLYSTGSSEATTPCTPLPAHSIRF